jgi:hypothetical protein
MKQNTQNGTYITVTIHNLHNQTEAHKTHSHIYSDTKWKQQNVTECDKPNNPETVSFGKIFQGTT